MKTVRVSSHDFDCLPGHVVIAGSGSGKTLVVAVRNAVREVLRDSQLRRKRLRDFKLTVVVLDDQKEH